ncbi:Nuclear factor of activated T-cells, cytoplasmic 4 [Chelonia mydas]|uniref:Nuclear factor of activated T-cells, cytoplasmic 4 n=1 Tax=Chelonia mydas TaxID=8469 RepID=M7AQF9_CHEMY|nr:Nuclear factor of activated T-cells, cytoplasmic 4 [Chelonia mydas]
MGAASCEDEDLEFKLIFGEEEKDPPGMGVSLEDWPLPSQYEQYELKIEVQPRTHHRAHYETEGSRGAVKAAPGGHPVVKLLGYDEKPLTLQMFIGTADERNLRPHAFYQVHRITGKMVATASYETILSSTKVLEMSLLPENNMAANIDCAGILKLRNSDIELRKGETDIGRKNTRVRLVFRVHVPQGNGKVVSIQAASVPIECSQRSAQELPLVERCSLSTGSGRGGEEMVLSGANFLPDSKVVFIERGPDGKLQWEEEACINPLKSNETTLTLTVPEYSNPQVARPVQVYFYVSNGRRKRSPTQTFKYLPASAQLTPPPLSEGAGPPNWGDPESGETEEVEKPRGSGYRAAFRDSLPVQGITLEEVTEIIGRDLSDFPEPLCPALALDAGCDTCSREELLEEARAMDKARFIYILRLFGLYEEEEESWDCGPRLGIVMEYMENGSLASLLERVQPVPWPLRFRLLPQLADFGLSKFKRATTKQGMDRSRDENDYGGTLEYMPPESLIDINYKPTPATDIYSYAILTWSVLTGQQPYPNLLPKCMSSLLRMHIPRGQRPDLEELEEVTGVEGLEDMKELMKRCWHNDSWERPTFKDCSNKTEKIFSCHKSRIVPAVRQVQDVLMMMASSPSYESRPSVSVPRPAAAESSHLHASPPSSFGVSEKFHTLRYEDHPSRENGSSIHIVGPCSGIQIGHNNSMKVTKGSRPVTGSLVPWKDSPGTDIFRNDSGDCIVCSDLGCSLRKEFLEDRHNVKIQSLHLACRSGDRYMGCVGDPNIYILKGGSYQVVKDLSIDEKPQVFDLHPRRVTLTKGISSAGWECIEILQSNSDPPITWSDKITHKVGFTMQYMSSTKRKWSISVELSCGAGELTKLIAQFQFSLKFEHGGRNVHTWQEVRTEAQEEEASVQVNLERKQNLYICQYRLGIGQEPVLFRRNTQFTKAKNPPDNIPLSLAA